MQKGKIIHSPIVETALSAARETRSLTVGNGILGVVPDVFASQFGTRPAAIVADVNTLAAAGESVLAAFKRSGREMAAPLVFDDPGLYAEHKYVEQIEAWLRRHEAVPVAVGSGTLNDLTKLASHRVDRPYMCVATAASMDGYTAFGASITYQGSKQTFSCPAPQAVVADMDVICAAPLLMNAAGYADLLAKVTAGADWLFADALGVEAIDARAWEIVQGPLRQSVSNPAGVRNGDREAITSLVQGLLMGGFAMQWSKSSRPASGAEHQFSHLWDMLHHTHNGSAPSHGFKVGVATLAVTRLYEYIGAMDLSQLANDTADRWPEWAEMEASVRRLFVDAQMADNAVAETRAKYLNRGEIRIQLDRLRREWPTLRSKLAAQLVPQKEVADMLRAAGAPDRPDLIGISQQRLRDSHLPAGAIRRRFTILDVLMRTGLLDGALERLYAK